MEYMILWMQNREVPKIAAVLKHVKPPMAVAFGVDKVGRGIPNISKFISVSSMLERIFRRDTEALNGSANRKNV